VAAQQGTSAADWTTPRCGPAFMQKDTRHLRRWLAVGAAGAVLGRADGATVDCVAAAAGDGENDEGDAEGDDSASGEGSTAAGDGAPVATAARWPAAVAARTASLADVQCAAAGSARLLGKPARACTHCQRATMPTISASLSAASTEGHVSTACIPIEKAEKRRAGARGEWGQVGDVQDAAKSGLRLKKWAPAKSARLKFGLLSCILGSMADEKVLTPEEQKVADVKAAQKAEAAAAKEAKEREKFIAKLIKEGGKPALSKRPPRALLLLLSCHGRPSCRPPKALLAGFEGAPLKTLL
jgi:hypothetical protein